MGLVARYKKDPNPNAVNLAQVTLTLNIACDISHVFAQHKMIIWKTLAVGSVP